MWGIVRGRKQVDGGKERNRMGYGYGDGWMAELVDAMDSKSIAFKGREGSNPSPPTIFKIKNIRTGFATNSSSTHSIVIVGKNNNLYKNLMDDYDFRLKNFLYRVFGTPDTLFEKKKRSGETGFRVKISHETHYYDRLAKFFYITGIIYKNIKNITRSDLVATEFLCSLYREITGNDFFKDFVNEIRHSEDLILDASSDEKNLPREFSGEDIKYLDEIKSDLIYINKDIHSWLQKNPDVFKKISQDVRDTGVEYEIANPDLEDEEKEDFKHFLKDLVKLFCSDNIMLYSFEYDESCPNNAEYLRQMNFKLDKPQDIKNLEEVLSDGAYYNNTEYNKGRSPVILNRGEKVFRFKREKVSTGTDYVFFNKITGTKLRFSLDLDKWNDYSEKLSYSNATYSINTGTGDNEDNGDENREEKTATPHVKALYPELVDLKITNYCVFGCEFCYQSSTRDGAHAPLQKLKKYINLLSDLKVFEIALGGGEPTMHPEFPEILEYIRKKGMIANFTTYSAKWLKDPKILEAVAKHVSGIGVSVHNYKDIEKVKMISKYVEEKKDELGLDHYKTKIVAQHVFGTVDPAEFSKLLKSVIEDNIHLLLLGPKRTGFGRNFNFIEPNDLLFYLKLYFNYKHVKNGFNDPVVSLDTSLSVDTEFARLFEKFLRKDIGVAPEMYTTREGLHSFYIDGVENKMAASSYVNPDEYQNIPVDSDVKTLKEVVYKNYLQY